MKYPAPSKRYYSDKSVDAIQNKKIKVLERKVALNKTEVIQREYTAETPLGQKGVVIPLIQLFGIEGDEIRVKKVTVRWTPTSQSDSWARLFSLNEGYPLVTYNVQSPEERKYWDLDKTAYRSWKWTDFRDLAYGGTNSREMTQSFSIPMIVGMRSNGSLNVEKNQIYLDTREIVDSGPQTQFFISLYYTDA